MNFKSLISLFAIIGILFFSTIGSPGCASIIPPSGGPKDSLPPILVKADPPDSSKNFQDKSINFTFDEYIELQNLQENVLISPTPTIFPVIESKLKNLSIKIKDTLEANTTYIYNFGKSIKDVNEGNILKDFSYIFSTGSYLDSLEFSGKVILAETGVADSTLVAMLHKNGVDSAVVNENPRYISKLDSLGNFHFSFLPPGKFYLYALKGEGGSYKYFNKTQMFAFADDAIEITSGVSPVTLYAFNEKKETAVAATAPASTKSTTNKGDDRRLKYSSNIASGQQDLLGPFIINFEKTLANFDTSKMQLSTDTLYIPEKSYSWELDSLRKKVTLKIDWKEGTFYNLILQKDFASDSSGRQLLKTDTIKFMTKKAKDYGIVKMTFLNFDSSLHPVLSFIPGTGGSSKSFPLVSNSFSQSLFPPGEYTLRILFDKNKNGKWDPGDFWEGRKQPELVKPVGKKITIKANWDNEFEIVL